MIRKILLGGLLFGIVCALRATGPADSPVQPQHVKVGFPRIEGYHQINRDRERTGYGYEYLQRLALYTDFVYEYLGYDRTWDENLKMLEEGRIDLLTSALKTTERLEKFAYSDKPIGNSAAILTVRAGERRYLPGDYARWNGIRVGMIRNGIRNPDFAAFAREKNFSFKPVYFDNVESLIEALNAKDRIDAAVTGNLRHLKNE